MSGIIWTARAAAKSNQWRSVTYGNGLFVAVSINGTNQVMTSPDGITWTARAAAAANLWLSVNYGNGLFVAVSTNGTNRVMTSGQLICVSGSTKILMSNLTEKEIKNIVRGDVVMEDIKTNKTNIVSRVISTKVLNKKIVKIPNDILKIYGETFFESEPKYTNDNLYITESHPIWINNGQNRILAKNINGCSTFILIDDMLYNIQYDTEGTFYANGIKIDSLSPYHKYYPLPKVLFIDKTKFIDGIKIMNEDDEIRNKPKMITSYDHKNLN